MRHKETAEMRRYQRDHLVASHHYTWDQIKFLKLHELLEKHMDLHPEMFRHG